MNKLNIQVLERHEAAIQNNFFYANKTTTQTAVPNAFSSITYNNTPVIKGWTYSLGKFTCANDGTYTVDYTCLLASTNNNEMASVRLTINSIEVIGSAITKSFVNNSQWTNSCLLNIMQGDILSLQFTGSSGSETISTASAITGETPTLSTLKVTLLA